MVHESRNQSSLNRLLTSSPFSEAALNQQRLASYVSAVPHDKPLLRKLQRQLKQELEGSAAFWRRATQAQSLWRLACFITAGLVQGHSPADLMTPLLKVVSYR